WKMTTFGLLLVGATALVTTLVMGYRADREDDKQSRAASRVNASVRKTSVPSQIEVEACQAYAQQRTGDKTTDRVKEVAIGGVVAGIGCHRDHGLRVYEQPEDRDHQEGFGLSRVRTRVREYSS